MFSMSRRAENQLRVLPGQGVRFASGGEAPASAPAPVPPFALSELRGRLVELGGQAALTMAFALVLDAQRQGEPTAWAMATDSAFYAPDVAEGGIDLDALAVVRLADAADIPRAANELARSGAFGLLVLDMITGRGKPTGVPQPLLGRLLGLAQKHDSAVVFLTDTPADGPSLGSLISLRAQVTVAAGDGQGDGDDHEACFMCRVEVTKDKRRAPGWSHEEVCRGPAGLR
jgi:recombination protein RecA